MTDPIRYVGANLTWQWGHDTALLHALADLGDVLLLVEARTRDNKPLDVAAILGPDWTVQQDTSRADLAGSATAVRVASGVRVTRSWLVNLSDKAPGVQARYQRTTVVIEPDGTVVEAAAGHAPLKATGQKQKATARVALWVRRATARIRRRKPPARRLWVWIGDANQNADSWAAKLRVRRRFGKSPMVCVRSAGWGRVTTDAKRLPGADHDVLVLARRGGRK